MSGDVLFSTRSQEIHNRDLILKLRDTGFDGDIIEVDNDTLASYLDPANAYGVGLAVYTYVLPGTIYNGTYSPGDPQSRLLDWIKAGGTLYWSSYEVGKYYYSDDLVVHKVSGNQTLFFGDEDVQENSGKVRYSNAFVDNQFACFKFKNASLSYGLSVSASGVTVLGCTDGNWATIGVCALGSGKVMVFSGVFNYYQADDEVQMIIAGIAPGSTLVDSTSGTFHGKISGHTSVCDSLYLTIGGYYQLHGASYWRF